MRVPFFNFPATLREVFSDEKFVELAKLSMTLSSKFVMEFPVHPDAEAPYQVTEASQIQHKIREFMQVGTILDRYGYGGILESKWELDSLLANAFFIVDRFYLFQIDYHSFTWRTHPEIVAFFERHGDPKHYLIADIQVLADADTEVKYIFDPEEFTGLLLCNDDQTIPYAVLN